MCSFVAHNGEKYVCQEMLTLPYLSGRTTHLILDLVPVRQLVQLVAWWEAGIHQL